jgi:multicomponent Na+:H+ antiporter subunit D
MTLVILPVLLPWVLAAVLALLDGRRPWVGWLAVAGLGAAFAAALWLALVVLREGTVETVAGGWPEGIGITLRADALGVTFAALSVGVILVSLVYEVLDGVRSRTFPALVCFMAAGLSGLFLTGDIFNFYVFFEIAMAAAFILTSYREKDYQVRAAYIFAIINLLGSVVFLIAVAALYHVTGSLDMETVASRIEAVEPNSVITIAAAVLVAFSLKLGLFPFHFWLPAVYIGSHASVAAILSGLWRTSAATASCASVGASSPRSWRWVPRWSWSSVRRASSTGRTRPSPAGRPPRSWRTRRSARPGTS